MATERLNDIKKNNFYKHMFFKFFVILFYSFFSNPSVFQWPPCRNTRKGPKLAWTFYHYPFSERKNILVTANAIRLHWMDAFTTEIESFKWKYLSENKEMG